MSDLGAHCPDVEAQAPELALGTLSGPERASALAHLAQCPTCRRLVDDLATTADPLLLLAPEMEPSIGFESRVLAAASGAADRARSVSALPHRSDRAGRARPARRRFAVPRAAVAAAVAVLAATGGLVVGRTLGGGGSSDIVRTAQAVSANGRATCRAFAYGDKQSWVFVSFEAPREWTADYTVEVTTMGGGSPAAVGHLRLQDGGGSLGTVVDVPAAQLRAVRVLDASGALRYEAPFHKG
ncbi:MAG: zf-HC2 domain-containing protein [Acidimicrobiales bacterium]